MTFRPAKTHAKTIFPITAKCGLRGEGILFATYAKNATCKKCQRRVAERVEQMGRRAI